MKPTPFFSWQAHPLDSRLRGNDGQSGAVQLECPPFTHREGVRLVADARLVMPRPAVLVSKDRTSLHWGR